MTAGAPVNMWVEPVLISELEGRMATSKCGSIAVLVCLCSATPHGQGRTVRFDDDEAGKPPKRFSLALTGRGKPGVWVVRKDDAAHVNVLVQTDADATDDRFPVAIYDDFTGADVTLSVQFKTLSGKGDQGAGLVCSMSGR